jgi:hypothetical protein
MISFIYPLISKINAMLDMLLLISRPIKLYLHFIESLMAEAGRDSTLIRNVLWHMVEYKD